MYTSASAQYTFVYYVSMPWQILTAISVITLSVSVLLQRLLLHQDKSDPIAYGIVFQALVGTVALCFALAIGFQSPDYVKYWLPISLTFLLYAAGTVAGAFTLRKTQASIYSVLFATNAIWVMIISLPLFHSHISLVQLAGVALIFISALFLIERDGKLKLDQGILLGLLTSLIYGLATVAWVYVDKHADPASWSAISFIGPAILLLIARPASVNKMKPFLNRKVFFRMALLGVLYSVSALTILMAYKAGNTSLVAPLQQTSIITTVLLAVIFLRERNRLWQKAVATALCFLGVVLIV
jgi:drug/metabolite transporter (DMT)-like permease